MWRFLKSINLLVTRGLPITGCPKRRAQHVFDAIEGTYGSTAPLPVAVANEKNALFGQPLETGIGPEPSPIAGQPAMGSA
jgi:hypothetical protein